MPFCYCPKSFVLEVVSIKRSRAIGEKKKIEQPQEDKRKKDIMRERFIKNKRPLNPTYISSKKEKQFKTKTTRRVILMSQSNDDEERETMLRRQGKYEDIVMRGSINPQQVP